MYEINRDRSIKLTEEKLTRFLSDYYQRSIQVQSFVQKDEINSYVIFSIKSTISGDCLLRVIITYDLKGNIENISYYNANKREYETLPWQEYDALSKVESYLKNYKKLERR